MASGPLIFGILLGASVFLGFIALWRLSTTRDPIEERMQIFGVAEESESAGLDSLLSEGRNWFGLTRFLRGFGFGDRLAVQLARAGLPLQVTEFTLIMAFAAIGGFAVGLVFAGAAGGVVLGGIGVILPMIYLTSRAAGRRRAITWQLPAALTLLVGALRAGHGLSQALEMVVDNLAEPAASEFAWVVRAVSLGVPVQVALAEMAERVGSDDVALVVTAINVQSEMGGNLAQTLETISETVRERIFMFRHIRVLTAQQRLSGYVLAAAPIILSVWLFLFNRDYISTLFEPGWIRLLPIGAAVLQVLGFLIMRKITDIEV